MFYHQTKPFYFSSRSTISYLLPYPHHHRYSTLNCLLSHTSSSSCPYNSTTYTFNLILTPSHPTSPLFSSHVTILHFSSHFSSLVGWLVSVQEGCEYTSAQLAVVPLLVWELLLHYSTHISSDNKTAVNIKFTVHKSPPLIKFNQLDHITSSIDHFYYVHIFSSLQTISSFRAILY